MVVRYSSFLAAVALAGCSPGELITGEDLLVLEGATLIDGTGATPILDASIVIDGTVLRAVGRRGDFRFEAPPTVVDYRGKWITPGFVDVHAHMPPQYQERFLATLLAFGITSARSPGAIPPAGVALRERLNAGGLLGPRLTTAGRLIDGPEPAFPSLSASVRTEAEIRQEVTSQAGSGVDFVKLMVGLGPDLVRAAIDEAGRHGIRTIGHLGNTSWREATDAGINSITHGWFAGLAHNLVPEAVKSEFGNFFVPNSSFQPELFERWLQVAVPTDQRGQELARAMASSGVTWDPNLVLGEAIAWGHDLGVQQRLEPEVALPVLRPAWEGRPHPVSATWSTTQQAGARALFRELLSVVEAMHQAGVVVTVGTDQLNPWITPGSSFHRELELLADAGISTLDIIAIASRNGALAAGLGEIVGTVEPGKRADLVVLLSDPLSDISNTRQIQDVFLDGVAHSPRDLLSPFGLDPPNR